MIFVGMPLTSRAGNSSKVFSSSAVARDIGTHCASIPANDNATCGTSSLVEVSLARSVSLSTSMGDAQYDTPRSITRCPRSSPSFASSASVANRIN